MILYLAIFVAGLLAGAIGLFVLGCCNMPDDYVPKPDTTPTRPFWR